MMSTKANETLKYNSACASETGRGGKVREEELVAVWDDVNESWGNEEVVWKTKMRGPGDWNPHNRWFRHNQTNHTLQISETWISKETKLVRFLWQLISQIRYFTVTMQEQETNEFIKSRNRRVSDLFEPSGFFLYLDDQLLRMGQFDITLPTNQPSVFHFPEVHVELGKD
jgi:hypothetical protein